MWKEKLQRGGEIDSKWKKGTIGGYNKVSEVKALETMFLKSSQSKEKGCCKYHPLVAPSDVKRGQMFNTYDKKKKLNGAWGGKVVCESESSFDTSQRGPSRNALDSRGG